jgi:hypothetical protein
MKTSCRLRSVICLLVTIYVVSLIKVTRYDNVSKPRVDQHHHHHHQQQQSQHAQPDEIISLLSSSWTIQSRSGQHQEKKQQQQQQQQPFRSQRNPKGTKEILLSLSESTTTTPHRPRPHNSDIRITTSSLLEQTKIIEDHNKDSNNKTIRVPIDVINNNRIKLQTKMEERERYGNSNNNYTKSKMSSSTTTPLSTKIPLWKLSDYIPAWLRHYSAWHHVQRSDMSPWNVTVTSNPSSSSSLPSQSTERTVIKVMVVSYCCCCDLDNHHDHLDPMNCMDKLVKPLMLLPRLLLEAHKQNRVLLLNFTLIPGIRLNDFLAPPVGGIDWRVPHWLEVNNDDDDHPLAVSSATITLDDLFHNSDNCYHETHDNAPSPFLLNVVSPSLSGSRKEHKNATRPGRRKCEKEESTSENDFKWDETDDETTFHDVWRLLFTPSDVINKSFFDALKSHNGLNPPDYVSIDLRHPVQPPPTTTQRPSIQEVINCAVSLYPGDQFLIAANTTQGYLLAENYIKKNGLVNVFLRSNNNKKKKTSNKKEDLPRQKWTTEGFYGIFVDLYLLGGLSRCVVYQGKGSIGHLSSLISFDASCSVDLETYYGCNSSQTLVGSGSRKSFTVNRPAVQKVWFEKEKLEYGTDFSLPTRDKPSTPRSRLPPWLTDYLHWHNETKQHMDENNWRSTQYLILVCFADQPCGGFSDRLKPIPSILLAAKRSKRLLLICWERPGPLENWLVPPGDMSGVDWRVPDWMLRVLKTEFFPKRASIFAKSLDKAEVLLKGGTALPVVFIQIQSPTGGELYYRDQPESDSTYPHVFHEIFRRFFQPVPRIAQLMDAKMNDYKLIPGQYAAVHLRAMYGNRQHRDAQEMIDLSVLGINCASNLLPGRPIYFASDTGSAVDAAKDYASMHSLPVASLEFDTNPLHLDKDPDWKTRSPSEFDATFIDMLMLAQSRCVAYSNGGYGTFGSLLSHESDCSLRFFARRSPAKKCRWMSADHHSHDLAIPQAVNNSALLS